MCNGCMACIPPCPTGSIDNWRRVLKLRAYTVEEQLGWDELPAELPLEQQRGDSAADSAPAAAPAAPPAVQAEPGEAAFSSAAFNATLPPWSAAHAYTNLYAPKSPTTRHRGRQLPLHRGGTRLRHAPHRARLRRDAVPGAGRPVDRHRAAGRRRQGRAHHARQYSIASPRNGERPGYNNLSLTVKRVLADHQGKPVRGVAIATTCATSRSATRCR